MPDSKIAITSGGSAEPFHSPGDSTNTIKIPALGLDLAVRIPPRVLDGAMTVLETINAAGFGPPLHRHRETEVFHVLEGAYLYEVNGNRFEAHAGDLVSIPAGAAHAFRNVSVGPSRQLVMMLPGMDAERFFQGLAEVLASPNSDRAALNMFGAPWGVEFLGPPLSSYLS